MSLSISQLLDIFYVWVADLSIFWTFISTPLSSVLKVYSPAYLALSLLGLADYSLLTIMLGAGIGLFVAYTIATWILNLVT